MKQAKMFVAMLSSSVALLSSAVADGRNAAVLMQRVDVSVPSAVYDEIGLPVAECGEGREGDMVPLTIAHPLSRPLIERGLTNLHNVPADRDAWEIVADGGTTYLLGSNPRAVMQAARSYVEESAYTREQLMGYDLFWDAVRVAKTLASAPERSYKAGLKEGKLETARKMKGKGFSAADIADLTGLTADEINAL